MALSVSGALQQLHVPQMSYRAVPALRVKQKRRFSCPQVGHGVRVHAQRDEPSPASTSSPSRSDNVMIPEDVIREFEVRPIRPFVHAAMHAHARGLHASGSELCELGSEPC